MGRRRKHKGSQKGSPTTAKIKESTPLDEQQDMSEGRNSTEEADSRVRNKRPAPSPIRNDDMSKHPNTNCSPQWDSQLPPQPNLPLLVEAANDIECYQTPYKPIVILDLDRASTRPTPAARKSLNCDFTPTSHSEGAAPAQDPLHSKQLAAPQPSSQPSLNPSMIPECPAWANVLLREMQGLHQAFGAVSDEMKQMNRRMTKLEQNVSELQGVERKVRELEKTTEFFANTYDSIQTQLRRQHDEIKTLQRAVHAKDATIAEVTERIVSQEERSMRDNLLSMGIAETKNEDTEAVLQGFMSANMPSLVGHPLISFERVHRIGTPSNDKTRHRPIVAKFSRYKDRDYVRRNARDLRNTNFSIREQFPKEVYDRRQKLQKKLSEAKKLNSNIYWKLTRDTLILGNKEYKVNEAGIVYESRSLRSAQPQGPAGLRNQMAPPTGHQPMNTHLDPTTLPFRPAEGRSDRRPWNDRPSTSTYA